MNDVTVAYSLIPYVRDVLIGLLPLVCLSEALRATFPFRERALLWYVGLIGAGLMVVSGGVPAVVSPWTAHTPLTAIGYFLGVYWSFRPRRRPTQDVELSAFAEHPARGYGSQVKPRARRSTLSDW